MTGTKQVSIHGRRVFLTDDNMLVAKRAHATGGTDDPLVVMPGSPHVVALWEDFFTDTQLGDTGGVILDTGEAGPYFLKKVGGTGCTTGLAAATNGVYRMTMGTAGTTTPAGGAKIIGKQLAWKVNQGKGAGVGSLRMGVRLKKGTYTDGMQGLFIGFTDVIDSEAPFSDTGDNTTPDKAAASNGFGFLWGSDGDTGWVGIAADGDAVQETLLTSVAPTDNKYVVLEMEAHRGLSDTGGTVSFYIDGISKGSIDNPCKVSTPLAPCVYVFDTGGASNLDIDWINVSAPRDTGT